MSFVILFSNSMVVMEGQDNFNDKVNVFATAVVKEQLNSSSASCGSSSEPLSCRKEAKNCTSGLQTGAGDNVEKELPFSSHEHHRLSREEAREGQGTFNERLDMIVTDVDEEELNSLSARESFCSGPLYCCDEAEDKDSGLQRTAGRALKKKLLFIPHEHQHQLGKEQEVMQEQGTFKETVDAVIVDIDEEELSSLSASYSSSVDPLSRYVKDEVSGLRSASDQTLQKQYSLGPHEHRHQISKEQEAIERQGNFNKTQDVTVADINGEDLTAPSASHISSVEPVSSCSKGRDNASGTQMTAGQALERWRPLGPREHQLSGQQEVMEQVDHLSGLVEMFISTIVKEELSSLSANHASSFKPLSCYSEDLAQRRVSSDAFQGIPDEGESRETDVFFSEILEQVMYRSSVPCSSVERFSHNVIDEVLGLQAAEDQVPLELQCQPSGELRVPSLPFVFSNLPSNLAHSDDEMLHERIRADDQNQFDEDTRLYMPSVLDKLTQVEVSDVQPAAQSCVLDEPSTTGASLVKESRRKQSIQAENVSSFLILTDQGKTLPPSIPSSLCEGASPIARDDRGHWCKWRVSKFHLVPKFRTKNQRHKNGMETQTQAAETAESLDVLSEVKGKNLPAGVPSPSLEERLPATEGDHSLPQPQSRYKWMVNKFHLVPKLRTGIRRHKNGVATQIQAAETSEVLDISSEFKGRTLPPRVPFPSWEETLPATEGDHSLPQPQGRYKWRVSKFHLVPKFRTKIRYHKTKVETQKRPVETPGMLDIPSEVKGKTLPPSLPSPSCEETLRATEEGHSIREPQVQCNWRDGKFHLVLKFRTKTRHFKNRVQPLMPSAENSDVLHIPPESTTQPSPSFPRTPSPIFRRFGCFECRSRRCCD